MLQVTPIVFVVDDDVSVRESLELLIRCEGWQRRHSRPPKNSSTTREFLFRTASYLMFLFRVLTG
jgi:FixJ family two-component response regulator